jgi:hypothetical protein
MNDKKCFYIGLLVCFIGGAVLGHALKLADVPPGLSLMAIAGMIIAQIGIAVINLPNSPMFKKDE